MGDPHFVRRGLHGLAILTAAASALLGGSCLEAASAQQRLIHQGPEKAFPKLPAFRDHHLTVFASSPEVNSPVSVVAEPGGAVLALLDENAGLGQLPHRGSVVRLVDEDNDGRADTMTSYIPDVDTPRGGHFLDGTLYLMHPPFVSAFRDTTGDGVADEHKVLAKGFGHDLSWKRGGDHTSNDLRVGIDGWIYVAVGDFGASAVGADGSEVTTMGGAVIRMRLDGSDLELYSEGVRNIYDLAVSPRMDILARDNTNDGDGFDMRLHHLTALSHMGYPHLYKFFSEDAMPYLAEYGGGSGCGALFLEEPGFPDWFNNRFQTISWGKMYTHTLSPNGGTFVNTEVPSLNLPKMVDVDVDGSSRLYAATFENGAARTAPGTTVGRIVRVTPENWKYQAFPDLESRSSEQLVAMLDQESAVLRHNAQRRLIEHAYVRADSLLKNTAEDESVSLEGRIAALYAVALRNTEGSVQWLKQRLRDTALREYALRALLDRSDRMNLNLDETMKAYLDDADARVRLQAIVAYARLDLEGATNKLLALSDDIGKRVRPAQGEGSRHSALPHTARRALVKNAPIEDLLSALASDSLRPPALAALRQIHDIEVVEGLIAFAESNGEIEEVLSALLRLYHREKEWDGESWWSTRPNSAGPYYQGVVWEGSEAIRRFLQMRVESMSEAQQKRLLVDVRRHNVSLGELNLAIQVDPLEQLLDQATHSYVQLSDLLGMVEDSARPEAMRTQAFRAALGVEGAIYKDWCWSILKSLATIRDEDIALYKRYVTEFVQSPSHQVSQMQQIPKTLRGMEKMGTDQIRLFSDVINYLAQSPLTSKDDQNKLVNGMRKMNAHVEFVDSVVASKSTTFLPILKDYTQSKDEAVRAASLEAIAMLEEESAEEARVGELSYGELKNRVMSMSGDVVKGAALFAQQACVACHSVSPSEAQKGPFLGTIAGLFDREQMIQHIVQPSSEVAQGFQTAWFKLESGAMYEGFVSERNEITVTLRNIVGMTQVIPTADIQEEGVREGSMMPDGLVDGLSLSEFASMLDYLESLH